MPGTISVDAIVENKIYLGNLSAALSPDICRELEITHVLSVCPENASTGPDHLNIPVQDSEYEDLLIHLPEACRFIQRSLDEGGRVLVHCVMGVSRSTTVICAYFRFPLNQICNDPPLGKVMWTIHLSASAAINIVKQRRPQVHPNYGFLRQLQAFSACNYEPSLSNHAYLSWKRKHRYDVTNFLNKVIDTIPVIPDKLFVSSEFPSDPEQAEALLTDLGMTHVLSLSPGQVPPSVSVNHYHINISTCKDALLIALPEACNFIAEGISNKGQVLVHCQVEFKASIVICSYLMCSRKVGPKEACIALENALPLFNLTPNVRQHLDLFEACQHKPVSEHPLVKAWTDAGRPSLTIEAAINATAGHILADTGIDIRGFNKTLTRIQGGIVGQG